MYKKIYLKLVVFLTILLFITNCSNAMIYQIQKKSLYIKNGFINNDENIDDIGWYTSIDIDSNNHPHISYYHYTDGVLKHAYHNGNSWESEIVDSNDNVGRYSSIAIDDMDNIHISYYDKTNGDLKYANYDSGSWEITTVDKLNNVGFFNCITLDNNNYPHISYVNYDKSYLKHAYWNGNRWITEKVDENTGLGEYFSDTTSIAIDNSNHIHISYCSRENFDLKYAYFDGSSWKKEIIDSEGDVGQYSSITLDAANKPHIAYASWTDFDLKYTYLSDGIWNIETVDEEEDMRKWASLILIEDAPYISYYDYTDGDLKLAYKNNNNWEKLIVDSEGAVGCFNSLTTVNNNLYISYYSWSKKSLKYASTTLGEEFNIQTIEEATINDYVDQQQYNCCGVAYGIEDDKPMAQSFIPTYSTLTRVELMMVKRFDPGNFTVSIRTSLDGEDLASVTKKSDEIAEDFSWKLFNFPDINVNPGEKYYIVCISEDTNVQDDMYWWYFDCNNPYANGETWYKTGNWKILTLTGFPDLDVGFKTYGLNTNIPTIPDIIGPVKPKLGEDCEYKFISYDQDNDDIYYHIKWEEDDYEIIGPYQSGVDAVITHSWQKKGSYNMKVKAVDYNGAESDWRYLKVTVPKNLHLSLLWKRALNEFEYLFKNYKY